MARDQVESKTAKKGKNVKEQSGDASNPASLKSKRKQAAALGKRKSPRTKKKETNNSTILSNPWTSVQEKRKLLGKTATDSKVSPSKRRMQRF